MRSDHSTLSWRARRKIPLLILNSVGRAAVPAIPLCHSRAKRRIPTLSSPRPVRERIEGEGPITARVFRARFKIPLRILFPCVILERSEESRLLLFAPWFSRPFVGRG